MKKAIILFSFLAISTSAFANDGGIAAIEVGQIKMRETALKDGTSVTVRKIAKPSFIITIDGGDAAKLQKILPSERSVFAAMKPEQAKLFDESFKSLAIYSNSGKDVTGKIVTISCSDAKFSDDYENIVKTGKSVCYIQISTNSDVQGLEELGDAYPFEPKSCK